MGKEKQNSIIVAKTVLNELLQDITGENEEWLFGKIPSKNVMIGMIDSSEEDSSFFEDDVENNKMYKSIPSIGMRFKVSKKAKKVSIGLKGKLFYRVRPTHKQQIDFLINKYNGSEGLLIKNKQELFEYIEKNPDGKIDSVVRVNKSISLSELGSFDIDFNDLNKSLDEIKPLLEKRLHGLIDGIKNQSIMFNENVYPTVKLLKEEDYEHFLDAHQKPSIPVWDVQLMIGVNDFESFYEISVQLVNKTNKILITGGYESAIFNGGIVAQCEQGFIPYPLNTFKHYYISNPVLYAIGNSCSVNVINEKTLETENIPIYEEHRVRTLDTFNSFVEFKKLIDNPVINLKFIHSKMVNKLESLYQDLNLAKQQYGDSEYVNEFGKEIEGFSFEINRFKDGIALIENKAIVRNAFKLTNKTFEKSGKYPGWRLFQIVFIVSEIADIINGEFEGTPGFSCKNIDNADLIYFPTGGGKTETFFGCMVFAGFFDRLRGKKDGVTAIVKYPLRLLAAQQLDRLLAISIDANQIKKDNNIEGDDFAVGFFAGSGNTPNRIDINKANDLKTYPQEMMNELYRQIDVCPICGKQMNIVFDEDTWSLKHICTNQECLFEPPVYITDDEIFRYAPSFIVSTIDKMASVGQTVGFNSLFGQSKAKCFKHGYLRGMNCNFLNCKCGVETNIYRKDPIPTLFIQDELHLVSESLGTFDSHYESFIRYYCEKLVPVEHQKKIKYIGATATISNFEEHIKELYGKDARMFPVSIKHKNFYSKVDPDDISRIIVGAALYGDSITESIQKLVTLMRIIVSKWIINADECLSFFRKQGFDGTVDELRIMLHRYLIEIVYSNSKVDAGNVFTALEGIGNNTLIGQHLPKFNIVEISSNIEFKEIKSIMYNVESDSNKFNTNNVIMATSSISHGVDEDDFNQIFFYGMPTQTAEYIQAYSRVGRKFTGIVFDIFRLVRNRDKSYLKNFDNFHEYKDLIISPVPINRYAKNAIYSTLPGIVAALFYQHYTLSQNAHAVTKRIKDGIITLDGLKTDVKKIYECDAANSKLYEQIIDEEVEKLYYAFVSNTDINISVSDLIRSCSTKHKSPMTSLRDVDVALEIKMIGE